MSTIKLIDVSVDGLDDKEQYNFIINNKGGNWPVKIIPRSGVFVPKKLNAYAYFCPSIGACPPNDPSVFYNIPSSNIKQTTLSTDGTTLYTVLDLVITNAANNNIVYTRACLVECDSCLPNIDISTDDVILDATTKNSATASVKISGLIPNQDYVYQFTGVDGNWPVSVLPNSGIIQSSADNYTLTSLVSFCASSGDCASTQNGIFKNTQINNCYSGDELYAKVELSITPQDISSLQPKTKTTFSIICNKCLPKPSVSLPNSVNLSSLSRSDVASTLSNLKIGEKYSYRFYISDANWPIVLYPNSGNIVPLSADQTITTRLSFCPTTGLCPPNATGVEPYTINNNLASSINRLEKIAKLKFELIENCTNTKVSSSETIVTCSNCLDKYSIKFNDSPFLGLGYPCCTGTKYLNATLTGSPYQAYSYLIAPVIEDATLSLEQASGIVTTNSIGSASINTYLTSNLIDGDTKQLKIMATNLTSGDIIEDTLTIRCGNIDTCG